MREVVSTGQIVNPFSPNTVYLRVKFKNASSSRGILPAAAGKFGGTLWYGFDSRVPKLLKSTVLDTQPSRRHFRQVNSIAFSPEETSKQREAKYFAR